MNSPRLDPTPTPNTAAIDDLLAELLSAETAYPYAWTWAAADQHYAELEQQIEGFAEIPAAEWDSRAQAFFAQVDACWPQEMISPLEQRLRSLFAERIPMDWLTAIASQAQQIAAAGLSPLDQLVDCVKPLLTNWSVDDLQVFARPLAYAMRSGASEPELPAQAWDDLSPVEQARAVLQVAKCALDEAQQSQTD